MIEDNEQGAGELPQDECKLFEAWACPQLGTNATDEKGFYSEPRVWTAWCAWIARSRLAQRAASVPAETENIKKWQEVLDGGTCNWAYQEILMQEEIDALRAATVPQAIKPDAEHLVALALSGALPDQQAGEILSAAYSKPATVQAERHYPHVANAEVLEAFARKRGFKTAAQAIAAASVPQDIGRDAALEEAAKVCESLCAYPDLEAGVDQNLRDAAEAIRALANPPANVAQAAPKEQL